MKVARFGRVRPVLTASEFFGSITAGPPGQALQSIGSNAVSWGSNIRSVTVNGSPYVLGPDINFANGSNTTVTVDMVGATASNTIRIHSTGGAGSFGSNATRVSEISSVGASANSAREDHIHDGIGTITASASNTMQRGTVNLRAGSGIALNLTDTDSDGEFDTISIQATSSGGGGGGGSGSSTAHAAALDRWHIFPFASTNSAALTITAASSGQRIVLAVATRGNDVTSVSCTNVTWTEVQGVNQSTNTYLSIYVGVVSGGSSGTTITISVGGTNFVFATAVIVNDTLTPTTVNSASLTQNPVGSIRKSVLGPISCSQGDFIIMAYACNDASNAVSEMWCSSPLFWVPDDSLCGLHLLVGKASATTVSGWFDGGNGAVAVGLVAVS